MRKPKTPPFRAGDRVKIIKPEFFLRCGYPLDFNTEVARINREKGEAIAAFLHLHGVHQSNMATAQDKVAKAIAYALVRQAGFGGKERKIYTHPMPEFADKVTRVLQTRFVKTGIWSRGGYADEYGPDPNYLSSEKTHRILMTDCTGIIPSPIWEDGEWAHLEIDAENVELVPNQERT